MNADSDGRHPSQADSPTDHADARADDVKPSALRIWLFRIISATVIPLGLLGLVELGLRIGGYGRPTSFFVEMKDSDLYGVNAEFGRRFFPRGLSRNPWPAYLPADKPDGAYRIFIMGGSAAQGVPDPAYSFGQILETMLVETYPDATFEVVATAMTAINSHVVLPIARDCARHEPDLFIVYMGNNEVVGPFGAGTVFQGFTPNLTLIRTYLAAQTTRLGQLVVDLISRLPGREGQKYWAGMEMFLGNLVSADDPKLQFVYSHFRRNLQDIRRTARGAGADTILCTVAVNLRHCSPFASQHRAGLGEAELARWDGAFLAGNELEQAGDNRQAIEHYLAAAAIDDRYAELQFRLGRCYFADGQMDKAREAFIAARDLDALRFRADSDINSIIREVAAQQGRGVYLVDAEAALAESDGTAARLPGETLFYEHVHMKFDGNYEVARALFPAVVGLLPEAIRSTADPVPAPPSMERCAQLMELTAWQRAQMLSYMLRLTEHPPFTEQSNYAERRAAMEELHRQLESQIRAPGGAGHR